MLAKHIFNKGLIFKMFLFVQLNNKKIGLKIGRGTESIFFKVIYKWLTGT